MGRPKKAAPKTLVVPVRLPVEIVEQLDEEAKSKGLERSQIIRDYIVKGLESSTSSEMRLLNIEKALADHEQAMQVIAALALIGNTRSAITNRK